jgi:tetratricopeptide (TPR) repeat protein
MTQENTNNLNSDLKTGRTFSLRFKLALLLGVISFIVYANTLRNDFALDDYMVIKENAFVTKGVSGIPEILATPYHRGFITIRSSNDQYRPLSLIVFAVAYNIFGPSPAAYHFLNVLLFACCIIMLFLFLDNFFARNKTSVAFIASLLFALHPIHTEVIANCKSLDELLCFFFAFLSLILFTAYTKSGGISTFIFGGFCFLLSLLAKETAITFVAIIPLIFFYFNNENKKRSISILVSVSLISCVFIAARYWILTKYQANAAPILFIDNPLVQNDLSFEARIATAILILGYYFKLLFVPYPLVCDYSFDSIPFVHFSDVWVLVSLAVYIFLIFFGIRRLLVNSKGPYAFSILFYLITIALFSNIFFLIGDNMAERFLFFPSVGFCLVIALLIDKWLGTESSSVFGLLKKPLALGIVIPVILVYSVITISRNNEWKNNETLFKADAKKSPRDARLCFFFGNQLSMDYTNADAANQKQFLSEATGYLERALEIYPDYVQAHVELGRAYFLANNYERAANQEKEALRLNHRNIDATNVLASVYLNAQQYPAAIALFNDVLSRQPGDVSALFNIGASYANNNDFQSAIAAFKKVIEIDPAHENYRSFIYTAKLYQALGKPDSAKMYAQMEQAYRNRK